MTQFPGSLKYLLDPHAFLLKPLPMPMMKQLLNIQGPFTEVTGHTLLLNEIIDDLDTSEYL